MKRFLKLSNREKIVVYFLTILVLLNLVTVVYTHNLSRVSEDFKSMLNDRLVPSADISKIQESFYKNRLDLESLIFNVDTSNHYLHAQILNNNKIIDSVLYKFSKTKLTAVEAEELDSLRRKMAAYRALENRIEILYQNEEIDKAQALFRDGGLNLFQSLNEELNNLSDLQVEVGGALYSNARDNLITINLISYFSIAVAIFLAISMFKVLGIKFQ